MECHDIGDTLMVFIDLFIVFIDWVFDIGTFIYYIRSSRIHLEKLRGVIGVLSYN